MKTFRLELPLQVDAKDEETARKWFEEQLLKLQTSAGIQGIVRHFAVVKEVVE